MEAGVDGREAESPQNSQAISESEVADVVGKKPERGRTGYRGVRSNKRFEHLRNSILQLGKMVI